MCIHPGIILMATTGTIHRGTPRIITIPFIQRGGHIAVTVRITVAAVGGKIEGNEKMVEFDMPGVTIAVVEIAMAM